MIQTPLDFVFFSFAGVAMAITALKPQWAIYALTYGKPERLEGQESHFRAVRIIAAISAIAIAVPLVGAGLRSGGL